MNPSDSTSSQPDCCASPVSSPPSSEKSAVGLGIGAAGAALVASACCWLPLVLIAVGASAAGVGATFERWRPLMLGITVVLLVIGFWYAYRPQRCAPGTACATVPPAKRRGLRATLWAVTVFTAVIASFPWYAPWLLPPAAPESQGSGASATADVRSAVYAIEGMTCAACANNLQRSLAAIPGIQSAQVDYDHRRAILHWDVGLTDHAGLDHAVRTITEQEGYRAIASGTNRNEPPAPEHTP